jgi:hypothetical protein
MFMPSGVAAASGLSTTEYSLTAGSFDSGNIRGYSSSDSFGSINPTDDVFGDWPFQIHYTNALSNQFFIGFEQVAIPDNDASWQRMEVTGTFNGGTNPRTITYLRSARSNYNGNSAGGSNWRYDAQPLNNNMVVGNVYAVEFFR